MKTTIIITSILTVIILSVIIFINQPSFGRLPRGERKARIEQSPNYMNGAFRNRESTIMTTEKSRLRLMTDFVLGRKNDSIRPDKPFHVIKNDLKKLDKNENIMVWFGHSSYLLHINGIALLVDPVFYKGSPVSFINKAFEGTDVFKPDDMPHIDYLIITHDHWDHLDYKTVKKLHDKTDKVICPLGVGEHFERWGYDKNILMELDWYDFIALTDNTKIHCMPARHFSGRGLKSNQTLWASYVIQSSEGCIFLNGDSGYGKHYAEIGNMFPDIDLAILENGQYNENWKYIHTMPQYLTNEINDLGTKNIITVHHSKFALSTHPWYEPLDNARRLSENSNANVIMPAIGEIIKLDSILNH